MSDLTQKVKVIVGLCGTLVTAYISYVIVKALSNRRSVKHSEAHPKGKQVEEELAKTESVLDTLDSSFANDQKPTNSSEPLSVGVKNSPEQPDAAIKVPSTGSTNKNSDDSVRLAIEEFVSCSHVSTCASPAVAGNLSSESDANLSSNVPKSLSTITKPSSTDATDDSVLNNDYASPVVSDESPLVVAESSSPCTGKDPSLICSMQIDLVKDSSLCISEGSGVNNVESPCILEERASNTDACQINLPNDQNEENKNTSPFEVVEDFINPTSINESFKSIPSPNEINCIEEIVHEELLVAGKATPLEACISTPPIDNILDRGDNSSLLNKPFDLNEGAPSLATNDVCEPEPAHTFSATLEKEIKENSECNGIPVCSVPVSPNAVNNVCSVLSESQGSGLNEMNGCTTADSGISQCLPHNSNLDTAVTNSKDSTEATIHTFLLPETLCGLFIGKSGRNISALKQESNTNVKVGRSTVFSNFRYCTVEGSQENIEKALEMVRKKYPNVNTTHVNEILSRQAIPEGITLSTDRMQLHLPMGVLSDVGISHIVNAGHIFVQQPAHPSFNSWQAFNDIMNKCYTDGSQVPPLPPNVEDSVLCVAPIEGQWHRAQIMSFSEDRLTCEVRLMDVGGYNNVATGSLRQVREDFLRLPFQASECYLANIEPIDGIAYTEEATAELKAMTFNQLVQCQPVAVADNGIPFIHIVSVKDQQVTVVNRELANKGVVKWYEM